MRKNSKGKWNFAQISMNNKLGKPDIYAYHFFIFFFFYFLENN